MQLCEVTLRRKKFSFWKRWDSGPWCCPSPSLFLSELTLNLTKSLYLVTSDRSPSKSSGSSSPSSCPVCSGSCTGGSVWLRQWRYGTRPCPPGRPPGWSCSPCPRTRTASWCGTWSCTSAPSDTARWPSRSPGGEPRLGGSPRRRTARLETEQVNSTQSLNNHIIRYSRFKLI